MTDVAPCRLELRLSVAAAVSVCGFLAPPPLEASVSLAGSQCAQITPGAPASQFGASVDVDGDLMIVGDFEVGNSAGAASIYRLVGGTWVEEASLLPSGAPPAPGDQFGRWVAIDGVTAVVTARMEDSVALDAGAVYVYVFDGTNWLQQQRLAPSSLGAFDFFGAQVDVSVDTLVAGAARANMPGGGGNEGEAYVFDRSGGVWTQTQLLTDPTPGTDDFFGASVSIHLGTIVVGSPQDDGACPGCNSGSAFVWEWDGATWCLTAVLEAPDADAFDEFGFDVAVDGNVIVVGSPFDDDLGPAAARRRGGVARGRDGPGSS